MGYAHEVLHVNLTPDQETILRHLIVPPCIVNVPAANNTGKTFLAAVAASWWYDSFPSSAVYSLAPTKDHVVKVLWAQLRIIRNRAGIETPWIGPKAPEIYGGPDHFAIGMTASTGESFRGRHLGRKLFILDEATDRSMGAYFDELPTMFDPQTGDAILYIYNPTDTTSRMYVLDQTGVLDPEDVDDEDKLFHRFSLSALDHPNIAAGLAGETKLPFPGAVNVRMLSRWVREECEPVAVGDRQETDIEWPPGSGQWHRPGPWFQARALGAWPDSGTGVWSDLLWRACTTKPRELPLTGLPEIGCDCATGKAEDFFAWDARWGPVALLHETSNTMDPAAICGKLKSGCSILAAFATSRADPMQAAISPKKIRIKIDDDATGNAVASFLRKDGYSVIQVGAGTKPKEPKKYPNKRSELWFAAAHRARTGGVYFLPAGQIPGMGLDRKTLRRLKQQLMAPEWELDGQGRRVVEVKDDTREKIGRSPDDADAFNLAYYDPPASVAETVEIPQRENKGGHFSQRGYA